MNLKEKWHVERTSAYISALKFKVEFALSIWSERGSWLSEGMPIGVENSIYSSLKVTTYKKTKITTNENMLYTL